MFMSLEQLVSEAKSGSMAAQKALFDRLSGAYLVVCRRYVKHEADAEERMLDGFYKFFKEIRHFRYESDEALYTFINRIMVNECLMQLRKKRVFNIVAEPSENDAKLDEDGLDRLSALEIQNLILQLPAGSRTVFNLYAIEGKTHGEIAKLLGISRGTSKSQLAKAKGHLQKSLSFLNADYERQDSK